MKAQPRFRSVPILLAIALSSSACLAQGAATTTTLGISPGTSVAPGTTITLAAHVTSNGNPFRNGTVIFCKADAPHCEDSALLGSAQVSTGGWAKLRLRLGVGTYSIQAVFQGTPGGTPVRQGSASAPQTLTVKGRSASITSAVNAEFADEVYKLVSRVAVFGREPISGSLSFEDAINGAAPISLGSDTLVPQSTVSGFVASGLTPINNDAYSFAVGDFNNDGIPDLVATNYLTNTLSILLGKGDGTFNSLAPIPADYEPNQLAVADFNGDGNVDIAVTYRDEGSVAILLGNGDGTFGTANHFSAGANTQSIVVADFNGDGMLDIVTGDVDGSMVSTLLGNGDGTFATPVNASVPGEVFGLLTGDFNHDGIPDLAASTNNDIFILLGKGDGTFAVASALGAGDSSSAISADFNGDGIPDLAMIHQVGGPNDDTLGASIYIANGDGTFTLKATPITVFLGNQQLNLIRAADFNGDGIVDLAAETNSYIFAPLSNSSVTVLLGAGDGTFPRSATPVQTVLEAGGAVADYNVDGIPDLLTDSYNNQVNKTSLGTLLGVQVTTGALHNVFLHPPATHSITPVYTGSSTIEPSSGPALTLNITADNQ
jgi:hypothetical protein